MQESLIEATAPVSSHEAIMCKCPGCGDPFKAGGRGLGKKFCTDKCRKAFHNLSIAEGQPLAPLVKAWHATRHAEADTREAEICRFARGQITEIARMFLDRDEDEGRDTVAYVGNLMDSGTLYIDRTRK